MKARPGRQLEKWVPKTTVLGGILARMNTRHTLTIDEGQRQLLLMALAHLAVERPGFDYALSEIAAPIDNKTAAGPELYSEFKRLHAPQARSIDHSAELPARSVFIPAVPAASE